MSVFLFIFFVPKITVFSLDFQQRRLPLFFGNLRESLNTMMNIIEYEKMENFDGTKTLENMDHLLHTYSFETSDVIHEYYLNRHYQQQSIESTDYGQLTVRCAFTDENNLEVRISTSSDHFSCIFK